MNNDDKWALLIGVDQYHKSIGELKYCYSDCLAIKQALVDGPIGFHQDQVLILGDSQTPDRKPTFANIHTALGSWLSGPQEADLLFVYFAGHGRLINGETHLIPEDATSASLHTLGIPLKHIQDQISQCKAQRKILFLDACHSGAGRDINVMTLEMQKTLSQGKGFLTVSSCSAEEQSYEWEEKKRGVFSYYLSEALLGEVNHDKDGRITAEGVYEWVHSKVVKWAIQNGCKQTPQKYDKGSGAIVLSSTTPDYREQNNELKRELETQVLRRERAEARLAEIEANRKTKELEDEEKAKEQMIKRNADKTCNLSSYRDYLERINDNIWMWIIIYSFIIFFALLIAGESGLLANYYNWIWVLIPSIIYWLLVVLRFSQHKNRYLLNCAKECLAKGCIRQGASYARLIGKLGINAADAGNVIYNIGIELEIAGDPRLAEKLYEIGFHKWNDPNAEMKLKKR